MSGIKILIVEDEAIIAEDIATQLEKMGYEIVDIVASGEEAIASALEKQPNLILMDIMLQGEMDGIEAAQKINAQINIPIVYLTAYADEKTLKRAKLTKPFGYLLKPFRAKELHTTIEISLGRHELEQEINSNNVPKISHPPTEKEKLEQWKSEYLSMAVHEFRNPLTHILGWTQLLRKCGESNKCSVDQINKGFNYIEQAAKTINLLLEDILMMARTEKSVIRIEPTSINLVNFCQELLQTLQFNSANKYRFNFESQENCICLADKNLLWHLLTNLLSNAVKYSPEGGEIKLKLFSTDSEVCFQIQDSGIGIPPEDLPHLFEPFSRGSNCGSISGTGLGLAIAKRCVDLHHGKIEVKSELNIGTTFFVTLPFKSSVKQTA